MYDMLQMLCENDIAALIGSAASGYEGARRVFLCMVFLRFCVPSHGNPRFHECGEVHWLYTGVSAALPADSGFKLGCGGKYGVDYGSLVFVRRLDCVHVPFFPSAEKAGGGGCCPVSCGKGQARVYESPQIDSPFLLGLLRPVIYLPAGMKGGRKTACPGA